MEDKLKILVVDDDPDFIDFARKVIEKEGCKVAVAPGEEEALALVESDTPPDLILLDVMMAKLDSGFQLLWKLKANEHLNQIPVIMVTAVDKVMNIDFATHALKVEQTPEEKAYLPVAEYIVKPVGPIELVNRVKKALNMPQK